MKLKVVVKPLTLVVAAALVLSLAGCTAGGGAVEYRDPSVPIVVEKGEEFTIVLESNPSGGFRWRLGKELDGKVVTLQKVEFEEPEAERRGQPGEEKWTFKATGLGHAEIVLEPVLYWREGAEHEASGSEVREEAAEKEEEATTAPKEWSAPTSAETEDHEEETEIGTRAASPGEVTPAETGVEAEALEPETLVFSVWVKEKRAGDKEPKKYEDPAETIEVKEGYRFSIVLESDPTAGHRWELARPLEGDLLALVSVTFEAKGGSHGEGEEEIGAPGEETWTFEALRPGETEIVLVPMEGGGESVTYKVEVLAVGEGESEGH